MEIIIKTKQKYNPFFSFLDRDDLLNPYYRHLMQAISSKAYVPKQVSVQMDETESKAIPPHQEQSTQQRGVGNESENDSGSEDSDEGGYELHPLLRGGKGPAAAPSGKDHGVPPRASSSREPRQAGALYATSMSINLAPAVSADSHSDLNTRGEATGLDPTHMRHHGR